MVMMMMMVMIMIIIFSYDYDYVNSYVDNYDKYDYVNSYVDQNNDDNLFMMRYIIYRMDALDVDSIAFALNNKVQRAKYKLGISKSTNLKYIIGNNSKSIGIEGSSSSSSSGSFSSSRSSGSSIVGSRDGRDSNSSSNGHNLDEIQARYEKDIKEDIKSLLKVK